MSNVNDFSELPGAGSGSEVGKGETFDTIWARQCGNAIEDVAQFNERQRFVENVPHRRIGDSDVFVDLRVERYAADGVTTEKEKDEWNKAVGGYNVQPCYGEIPSGFTGFSEKGFSGNVLLYDGDSFSVCDKSAVNLSGYKQLPDGWTKTVMIEKI